MKKWPNIGGLGAVMLLMALTALYPTSLPAAAPAIINYQGKLTDIDGNPVTGAQPMVFEVFSVPNGGSALYTEIHAAVPVVNGVFSTAIGSVTPIPSSVFQGTSRYLQVTVNGTALSPRRPLYAAPYALAAAGSSVGSFEIIDSTITNADISATADIAVTKLAAGNNLQVLASIGTPTTAPAWTSLSGDLAPQTSSWTVTGLRGWSVAAAAPTDGQVLKWNDGAWAPAEDGGGPESLISADWVTVTGDLDDDGAGGVTLGTPGEEDGITIAADGAVTIGTTSLPSTLYFNGDAAFNNRVGIGTDSPNAALQVVGAISRYLTLEHGINADTHVNLAINSTTGDPAAGTDVLDATIGGGFINEARNDYSTVGGGVNNRSLVDFSTIGGGFENDSADVWATVSGGDRNVAARMFSTVSGGLSNRASGRASAVCGGEENRIFNDYSVAMGRNMHVFVAADRTFAWGYSDTSVSITQPDSFIIHGSSVGIGTATPVAKLQVVGGDLSLGDGAAGGNQPVTMWMRNTGTAAVSRGQLAAFHNVNAAPYEPRFARADASDAATRLAMGVVYDQSIAAGAVGRIAVFGVVDVAVNSGTTHDAGHCVVASGDPGTAGTAPGPVAGCAGKWLYRCTGSPSCKALLKR